jgi:hypothetical protein
MLPTFIKPNSGMYMLPSRSAAAMKRIEGIEINDMKNTSPPPMM